MRYFLLFCTFFISSIRALTITEHLLIPRVVDDDFYRSLSKRSGRLPGSGRTSRDPSPNRSNSGSPRAAQGANPSGSPAGSRAEGQGAGPSSPRNSAEGSSSRSGSGQRSSSPRGSSTSSPVKYVIPEKESPPVENTKNRVKDWEAAFQRSGVASSTPARRLLLPPSPAGLRSPSGGGSQNIASRPVLAMGNPAPPASPPNPALPTGPPSNPPSPAIAPLNPVQAAPQRAQSPPQTPPARNRDGQAASLQSSAAIPQQQPPPRTQSPPPAAPPPPPILQTQSPQAAGPAQIPIPLQPGGQPAIVRGVPSVLDSSLTSQRSHSPLRPVRGTGVGTGESLLPAARLAGTTSGPPAPVQPAGVGQPGVPAPANPAGQLPPAVLPAPSVRTDARPPRTPRRTSASLSGSVLPHSVPPIPRIDEFRIDTEARPLRPAVKYKDIGKSKLQRTKSGGDMNRKVYAKGDLSEKANEKVDSIPFLPQKTQQAMNKMDRTGALPWGDPHSAHVPKWRATARRSGPNFEIPAGPDTPPPTPPAESVASESTARKSGESMRSSQRWLWGRKRPAKTESLAGTARMDPTGDGTESITSSRSKSFFRLFRQPSQSDARNSLGSQPSQPSQPSRATGGIAVSPFATAQPATGRTSFASTSRPSQGARQSIGGFSDLTAASSIGLDRDRGHILPGEVADLTTTPSVSTLGPLRNTRVPSSIPRGPDEPRIQTVAAQEAAAAARASGPGGPAGPGGATGANGANGGEPSGSGGRKKLSCLEKGLCALGAQAYYGESNPGAVSNFVGNAVAGVTTVTGVALGAATFPAHAIIGPVVVGVGVATGLGMNVHAHINNVKNHAEKEKIPGNMMFTKGQEQGFGKALSRTSGLARKGSKALGVSGMKPSASTPDLTLAGQSGDSGNNGGNNNRR